MTAPKRKRASALKAISSQIATTSTTAIQPSALPTPTPQASALATTILSISSQPTVASGSPPPDDESIDVEENRFFFLKDQLDQQAAIHEVLLERVNELTKALQRPTDQSTLLPPPIFCHGISPNSYGP
jgi:hypothetical protein